MQRRVASLLAFMTEDGAAPRNTVSENYTEPTSEKMSREGVLQVLLRLGISTTDEAVAHSVASAVANLAKLGALDLGFFKSSALQIQ